MRSPKELKPCPFCGGEAKADKYTIYGSAYGWFVYCKKCGIETNLFTSRQNARFAWDRRVGENNEAG